MIDRFDIVTVRVEDERAVVLGMIVRAQTGFAVVAPACRDTGGVKCIDERAIVDAKCKSLTATPI